MGDIQILIENIRKSVAFSESVTPDQMQVYARQYTESCTELNRRMMQCIQQIRAGNISEGVRLAELKPNLTEMYLSLDIPEREEWHEIVTTLGFDMPPPFPVELSKEVNEAYMKLAPLEPLLRWHRLHALNSSSIKERLAMIRSIAKTDRENIYWSEDQEKFEKARIKELGKEVQQAIETKNFDQIVALHAELNAPDWMIQPPPDFRWKLAGVELQNEADLLMEKFYAFEHDEVSNIYARMQQIAALEKMAIPPAIRQLISPAVQWLNETKRQDALQLEFHHAADELQDALGDGTELPELERLYDVLGTAATQAEMDVPEELEKLYRTVISRRRALARRNALLTILAIILICLLFRGIFALGWDSGDKKIQREDAIAKLKEFEDKLETSKEPVENLSSTLKNLSDKLRSLSAYSLDVSKRVDDMERIIDNYKKDAIRFTECCDKADDSMINRESPSTVKIYVDEAKILARTQTEEKDFADLNRKFGNYQRDFDKPYLEKIHEYQKRLNDSENDTDQYSSQALERLEKVCEEFRTIPRRTGYSQETINRANSLAQSFNKEIQLRRTMQELFSAVPDWAAYQSVLQRLALDFSAPGADATKVLEEMEDVRAVAVILQDFASSYTKAVMNFNTLQQVSVSLKKKHDNVSTRFSGVSISILPPNDIFETLSKISPYTQGTFTSVRPHLENMARRELFPVIERGTNKWYYLTTDPTEAHPGSSYYYVTKPSGDEIPCPIAENQFRSRVKIPNITPYDFARETQKRIDGITNNGETVVNEILNSLFEQKGTEPGIDQIIQCKIMDALIHDMSNIDPFFASNFAELREDINRSNIDPPTNWMDADSTDTDTVQQRNKAQSAVTKFFPKIQPAIAKTRQDRAEFMNKAAQFHPRFEWAGVLTKTGGKWDCVMKPGSINTESDDLYILRRSNQTVVPVKIGQISSGEIKLQDNKLLLQCAPVFFVQH